MDLDAEMRGKQVFWRLVRCDGFDKAFKILKPLFLLGIEVIGNPAKCFVIEFPRQLIKRNLRGD